MLHGSLTCASSVVFIAFVSFLPFQNAPHFIHPMNLVNSDVFPICFTWERWDKTLQSCHCYGRSQTAPQEHFASAAMLN